MFTCPNNKFLIYRDVFEASAVVVDGPRITLPLPTHYGSGRSPPPPPPPVVATPSPPTGIDPGQKRCCDVKTKLMIVCKIHFLSQFFAKYVKRVLSLNY